MDRISTALSSQINTFFKHPFAEKSYSFEERINLSAVEPTKSLKSRITPWLTGNSMDTREASSATKTVAQALLAYNEKGDRYTDHNSIAYHAFENKNSPERIEDFMESAIIQENWSALDTIVKHTNGLSCRVAFKNIVSRMLEGKQACITACNNKSSEISIFNSVIRTATDQQLREYFTNKCIAGLYGGETWGINILSGAVSSLAHYDPPALTTLLEKLGPEYLNTATKGGDSVSLLYNTLEKRNLHLRDEEIKRLLEAGMDPNWKSPITNTTALHNLCERIEPDRVFATDKKALIDHL